MKILLFYRCRWCLETFAHARDDDNHPESALKKITDDPVKLGNIFTFHNCDDNGTERTGIADLIGARYE